MKPAFRFGLAAMAQAGAPGWIAGCVRAADQGYDILLVPDHLGTVAPFPAAVAAAQSTHLRVGTYVLNSGFYHPGLVAREVATTIELTGGRFELGLGTGYVHREFATLGIDPGSPKDRVDDLERVLRGIPGVFDGPRSAPLLIAGNGSRVLRLAARHADIVSFLGMQYDTEQPGGLRPLTHAELAERVEFFDVAAGTRSATVEKNLAIRAVVHTEDRNATLAQLARTRFRMPVELLDDLPVLLIGTIQEMAEQLERLREQHGISYFVIPDLCQDAFAPVIAALKP